MQPQLEAVLSSCTRSVKLRAAATVAWSQIICVLVFALATAALRAQSTVRAWGLQVFDSAWDNETFVQVAAGSNHTVARRSDGSVVAWGAPGGNVPALPAGLTYVEVAAGGPSYGIGHTVARRSDGSVIAWGNNAFDQCDVPALPAGLTYVEVTAGGGHSVARRSDGSLVAWGLNSDRQCNVPSLPTGLTYVEVAA